MPGRRKLAKFSVAAIATVSVLAAVSPGSAAASLRARGAWNRVYGATALTLDPTTASTLTTGLGLSVAPVAPAYAAGGAIDFPITSSLSNALFTGEIDHSGGIALSGGGTTVDLTNFVIDLRAQTLTADLSVTSAGGSSSLGAVDIVSLSLQGARFGLGFGTLRVGPIQAALNDAALGALGNVFGVSSLGTTITSLPLGVATVNYRLF